MVTKTSHVHSRPEDTAHITNSRRKSIPARNRYSGERERKNEHKSSRLIGNLDERYGGMLDSCELAQEHSSKNKIASAGHG